MKNINKNKLPELTKSATNKIKNILKDETSKSFVKLSVDGGGCAGFSYKFSINEKMDEDDIIVSQVDNKILLVVDSLSLDYLNSSTINWKASLTGSMFEVINPIAKSSCGCGSSFSI